MLYRFCEARGEHTRLDWEDMPLPPETTMRPAPESLVSSLQKHRWVATESRRFAKKDHINLLELEMLKAEIRDRVNSGNAACRVVNLCDSRVVVGAFAKGRSSSKNMNHGLRSCLPWLLTGNLQVSNLWVDTHSNPADYPSRFKPIPAPDVSQSDGLLDAVTLRRIQTERSPGHQVLLEQEARKLGGDPPWESSFSTLPQPTQAIDTHTVDENANRGNGQPKNEPTPPWTFREIFAGKARLTEVFKRTKRFETGPPVELRLRPNSHHNMSFDIMDDRVFEQLVLDAAQPRQTWHFGLPCCSFSILQHSNGGTRRKDMPQGDGSLPREILGNELLRRTMVLIKTLERAGNF